MDDNVVASTNEQELLKTVDHDKGFDRDYISNKPVLVFKGIEKDILADGFMLLIGHGAKDYLKQYATSRKAATDFKKGLHATDRKEVESWVQEQLKNPTGEYPDIKRLIPKTESMSGELTVVGAKDIDGGRRFLYLSDGDRVVGVDAEKYAFLKNKLPSAKLYGTREYDVTFPNQTDDKLGESVYVYQDKIDPTSPISFVVNGKVAGVVMPVYLDEIPDIIKSKAASIPITTKPIAKDKPKANYSGVIDIDSRGGSTDLLSYMSKMEHADYKKVWDGHADKYDGSGSHYIIIKSKELPDHVIAWKDTRKENKYTRHDVARTQAVSPTPKPAQPKQPWEMTREELSRYEKQYDAEKKSEYIEKNKLSVNDVKPPDSGDVNYIGAGSSSFEVHTKGVRNPTYTIYDSTPSRSGFYQTKASFTSKNLKEITDWANERIKDESNIGTYYPEKIGTTEYDPEASHKEYVEYALAEGKPVPPEVLKDYPELKKQADIASRPPRTDQIGSSSKPKQDDVVDIGGYEQTLSPANRAKAIAQMNMTKMISGKPQSRKQYIEAAVSSGAVIGIKEKQPALVFPDGRYMRQSEITKTALDYANYLINKQIPQARVPGVQGVSEPSAMATPVVSPVKRDKKQSSTQPSFTELMAIHEARSPRSRVADEGMEHSLIVDPDDPRVKQWIKDPGRMDVRGVDTPRKSKTKAKPKRRASTRKESPTKMKGMR